jgi:hypothetical protein
MQMQMQCNAAQFLGEEALGLSRSPMHGKLGACLSLRRLPDLGVPGNDRKIKPPIVLPARSIPGFFFFFLVLSTPLLCLRLRLLSLQQSPLDCVRCACIPARL